jgi:hypothetical protein
MRSTQKLSKGLNCTLGFLFTTSDIWFAYLFVWRTLMAQDDTPLSDEERSELEQLRAEKAARDRAAHEARERAEFERLKADKQRSQQEAAAIAHEQAQREQGRKLMEPDEDDLRMPIGQKVVLIALGVLVLVVILSMVI